MSIKRMYTWVNLNLREEAQKGAKSIVIIPKMTNVEVLSEDGEWSKVSYNDNIGYVYNYYLSVDGKNPNNDDLDEFHDDILKYVNEKNVISNTNYLIATDLDSRFTYIFVKENYKWVLKSKWQCTVGKPSTPTITGSYNITGREPSFGTDKYSVKYATRIKGGYYYHSILYDAAGKYIIDGRLGQALSHGCVRLATENAKWIYENIPDGTKVIIH